jgi:hypothetical protein
MLFDRLVERYSPLAGVSRTNPVLHRELRSQGVGQLPPDNLPLHSELVVTLVTLMGIGVLALVILRATPLFELIVNGLLLLTPLALFGSQVVYSVGVDLHNLYLTISTWHQRGQPQHIDLVRLTSLDEGALASTYFSLTHVRLWWWLRVETALRAVIPMFLSVVLGFLSCTLGVMAIIATYSTLNEANWLGLLTVVTVGVVVVAFTVSYVREPVWRARSVTAFGLLLGTQVRDTSTALLLGSLLVIGWRVLLAAASFGLLYMAVVSLFVRPVTAERSAPEFVMIIAAFLLLNRVLRGVYHAAYMWSLRRAVSALRAGE